MEFRTKIPIARSNHQIDYNSHIVSLGSCFAVNIADKFAYYKFRNIVNPIGILFHPAALEKFVVMALDGKRFDEADVFFHNERWHCFDAHSQISNVDKQQLLDSLNEALVTTRRELFNATHLILTLGTAWVYQYNETGAIVANCHKVPQKEFTKHLLRVDQVASSLSNIISRLSAQNKQIQILLTVSPVRHIKDGFVENQRSKAHLITSLHEVIVQYQNTSYFPSYEIMMDELRDYRFYSEDMLHPSLLAVDYIWNKFAEAFISDGAQVSMDEISQIQRGLAHIPFNSESSEHLRFRERVSQKIEEVQLKHPHIIF